MQKRPGAHVATHAELIAAFLAGDDVANAVLMPSVGVSIPICRYPVSRTR